MRVVSPARLAKKEFTTADVLVAAPSLERLPAPALRAISAHAAVGGDLLASGGEPFREPLYPAAGGHWIGEKEVLAGAQPFSVILEPATARLRRSSSTPGERISRKVVPGPGGKPNALEVEILNLAGWETLQAEFSRSPFAPGQTLTVVTVQGTPGQMIAVEWREADGTRWVARVPLTAAWQIHVLRPTEFHIRTSGAETKREGTHFRPDRARAFSFGPTTTAGASAGAAAYAIAPVAVAVPPPLLENFEPAVLETISPWYKQYETRRNGRVVRVPFIRPRGLTGMPETEGRYQVVGPLLHPAATRYFTSAGANLIWLPWPALSGAERAETIELLRAAGRQVGFLNAGATRIVVLPGEPIAVGARVLNASRKSVVAEVAWSVRVGSRRVSRPHVRLTIPAGEARDVKAALPEPLPPGEYRIDAVLTIDGAPCDRLESYLRLFDPAAPRRSQQRIRASGGHFTARGRRIFLHGINYRPRSVAGLEPARYRDHWLTPQNYDPDVSEADLAAISKLGFNMVSIQYNRPDQGRPLLDFLERCRRHGIWANVFIGAASRLRFDPARNAAMLRAALLPGNETVFAYDLAWEPHFGKHNARCVHDDAWRAWVLEQYGTLPAAEQAWGVPAPKDERGRLTNPSDRQISEDGPHRVLVAAYRRFLDDLVSRLYGRVVRHLRTLDPEALFGVRTGYGGTGQRGNNEDMGYDLLSGAAHLDFISPESYGMPLHYQQARSTGFITAYARYAGHGKPVFWSEFGASIGPRDGTAATRRDQARLCETMMRVIADSGADAMAVWWWAGGWRVNELSDYGVSNPDGTPRESAIILGEWGRKFISSPPEPLGSGRPLRMEIDRDADARGLHGLWERSGDRFVYAREAGRRVLLVTPATCTDTAAMPRVQVGNVPYRGTGPLKYANAEIAALRVGWAGGERTVENGSELEVPGDTHYEVTVTLVNTGEAAWTPAGVPPRPGACLLRTTAGDAPLPEKTAPFSHIQIGPLRVYLRQQPFAITGRLTVHGLGPFGEMLRVRLRPAGRESTAHRIAAAVRPARFDCEDQKETND